MSSAFNPTSSSCPEYRWMAFMAAPAMAVPNRNLPMEPSFIYEVLTFNVRKICGDYLYERSNILYLVLLETKVLVLFLFGSEKVALQ